MEKDYTIINGELYHWGVLGMKWGVRKKQPESQPQVDARSDDKKKYDNLRKKPLSEMSNAEIRAYLDRLNLERQYQAANPTKSEKTKRFIKTAISDAKTAYDAYQTVNNILKVFDGKGGSTESTKQKALDSYYTNTPKKPLTKNYHYSYYTNGDIGVSKSAMKKFHETDYTQYLKDVGKYYIDSSDVYTTTLPKKKKKK